MNIKYKKLLLVGSIIDLVVGLFLFVCGILEFTGVMNTDAHNITETIGVHVSYLVFISGALLLATGTLTVIMYNKTSMWNMQILLGVVSLAWPLFLQVSLFFTQLTINIRLVISVLTSLFYVIAILIVKISNEEFVKRTKFNPSAIISQSGKRTHSVNVERVFTKNPVSKSHKIDVVQSITNSIGNTAKPRRHVDFNIKRLFIGRRRSGMNLSRKFYSGGRRRSSHALRRIGRLFSGFKIGRRRF